jgi:hypothetical protein
MIQIDGKSMEASSDAQQGHDQRKESCRMRKPAEGSDEE